MAFISNSLYKIVSKCSKTNEHVTAQLNMLPHLTIQGVEDMRRVVEAKLSAKWTNTNQIAIDGNLDTKEYEEIVAMAKEHKLEIIPFSLEKELELNKQGSSGEFGFAQWPKGDR
ncbi:hypothetical protein ACE6H2_001312 [Prunus campanulata]